MSAVVVGRADLFRKHRVPAYAWAVALPGLLATAVVVAASPPWRQQPGASWWQLGALAGALVIGELTTIAVDDRDRPAGQLTTSTTFALALLALGPVSFLLLVHLVAVGLDDLRTRRRPLQLAFNAGQYALSILAGRVVFCALTGDAFLAGRAGFDTALLVPMLVAGLVMVAVNERLVRVVTQLEADRPVGPALRGGLGFLLRTSGVQLALGPVAALVATTSSTLLPLLLVPTLALGRSTGLAAAREHDSLHDPLTGLANRRLLNRRLEESLRSPADDAAVLLVDLDRFKEINDTYGHDVGDLVLRRTADQLRAFVEPLGRGATAARLGGDEFVVLLTGADAVDEAGALARELLDRLSHPGPPAARAARSPALRASVGVARTRAGRPVDASGLLRRADLALYRAKRHGDGLCVADED